LILDFGGKTPYRKLKNAFFSQKKTLQMTTFWFFEIFAGGEKRPTKPERPNIP
jgi:hypothetical protein